MTGTFKRHKKTGLLLLGAALFVFVNAMPAQAQSGDLTYRLNQLENQIQTLSRSVYRGESMPPAGAASSATPTDGAAAANLEVRLSEFESQLRQMRGDIERQGFEVQQMKSQLERALADTEMRLTNLERGGTAAAVASQTQTAPAAAQAPAYTAPASASVAGQTPEALYDTAFSDVREAKYEDAESRFKTFLAQYQNHPLASNAQYWLGETYYVRGNYSEAAKSFAQGYQNYPKSSKAADSLLKLGLSLGRLGKTQDACLSFNQMEKEFPGDHSPVMRRAAQEKRTLGCN